MPNKDGTGPLGQGSTTGRGMGPCGCGQRRGFGRGRGMGFRNTNPVILTKEEEKKILEAELKEIDLDKQEIENKLKAMN
ncbi:MAG: DUF5320 domain-containing protein [Candidatus Woesearchaeota archaeon]|jgi:hypothetical protein